MSILAFVRHVLFSRPEQEVKESLHRSLPFLGVFRSRLQELQQDRESGIMPLGILLHLYEALASLRSAEVPEVLKAAESTLTFLSRDYEKYPEMGLLVLVRSVRQQLKGLKRDPSGREIRLLQRVTPEDIYLGSFPVSYWQNIYRREGMSAELRAELDGAYQWLDRIPPLIKAIQGLEKMLE